MLGKNALRRSSVTSDALLIIKKKVSSLQQLYKIHSGHLQKLLHPTRFAIL